MSLWPRGWSREARSSATIAFGALALVLLLWLMAIPLAWAPEPIGNNAQFFAEGARVTALLTVVAGACGVLLGVVAAVAKVSPWRPVAMIASLYVWIIRGTPLLVQVLFVYFALPSLVPALRLSDFASACVALSINAGAYNAEAIRAGLRAVPIGQREAARALALSPWHAFVDVIFPQALEVSLPPLVNNLVALLKDSSLAYAIGVVELTNVGNRIQAATFQPVPVLLTSATIYLLLTTLMTQMSNAVERRLEIDGR